MHAGFSIITPAYRASSTIARAVQSVLAQTFSSWEMLIICDDEGDYKAQLDALGLGDERIRFLDTGRTGSGSSNARNVGLEAARNDLVAILDADDFMVHKKLAALAVQLADTPLISSGIEIQNSDGTAMRRVGCDRSGLLSPQSYKFTNFSMDSMIAYRRDAGDPRYDADLPCLTDLDFIFKLFATRERCFHIAEPLHIYVKQPVSITNGPGTSQRIAKTKQRLLQRLETRHYNFATQEAGRGFCKFLRLSLAAEKTYEAALKAHPGLLFEDHLEPFLVRHPLS